jgi:hypothetical protein
MAPQRILLSLVTAVFLVVAATSFSLGERGAKSYPVGEVSISTERVSLGIGYTWGHGTLRYKGRDYKFKVNGLNMIGLGFSTLRAKGDVYNMRSLADFPGTYYGVEAGV